MRRNQFRGRRLAAAPFNARWPFWVALAGALGLAIYLKRRKVAEAAASAGQAASKAAQYVEEAISSITDKAEWAKAVYGVVGRELPTVPVPARLVIVAKAALESGWGQSRAAKAGNNIFNVIAGTVWTGPKWVDVDGDVSFDARDCKRQGREMVPRKKDGKLYCKIDQTWRKYGTVGEAVQDYWKLLGITKYKPARDALEQGDITEYARKLREAGYYSAPVDEYTASLRAVVRTVQRFLDE